MAKTKETQNKQRKQYSLRFGIISLIMVCWVLPMMLTIVGSGVLFYRSAVNRVAEMVTAQLQHTAAIVQRDLDGLTDTLLNISYDTTMRTAYTNYLRDKNSVNLITTTSSFISRKFYKNQLVRAAFVVYPGFEPIKFYDRYKISWRDTQSFNDTEVNRDSGNIIKNAGGDIFFAYENDKLYACRVMSLPEDGYTPFALVAVDVNVEGLLEPIRNQPLATNATVIINDIELNVQGDAVNWNGNAPKNEVLNQTDGSQLTVALQTDANRYNFGFKVYTDISPLVVQASSNIVLILIVAAFSAALVVFALQYIRRRVNRPITELSVLAAQVEQGNFGVQCSVQGMRNTEFMYLGTQMNNMSERLKNQFERIYREEIAARDAQIKALQSQINPHFLGNTLEIINWEARLAGNVKISQMMEALSTLMRAMQNRNHQQLIPLSEEMMFVNSYLFITQQRFGERLKVHKQIGEEFMNWKVPRLILQPLVENAIEHGVNEHQKGEVIIRAVQHDENSICLEVENDALMSEEDEKKVHMLLDLENSTAQGAVNIGIRNVHLRLKLIYGQQSGLTIESSQNGGTVSRIRIMEQTE